MRQRATTAVVLVPLLLIVIAIGGFAISIAIALITIFAAREVFTLLRSAGHPAPSGPPAATGPSVVDRIDSLLAVYSRA